MNNALLALVSILIPAVPVLYLYNRNFDNLEWLFVVGSLGLMLLVSALVFGISWALSRSPAAAFGVCLAWWVGVVSSKSICSALVAGRPAASVVPHYMIALVLLMFLVGFVATRRFRPTKGFVAVSCSVLAVMILLNLLPLLWKVGALHVWVRWYLKPPSAALDSSLPSPDVYWIHCDSMMGFQAMQECFGYDQTDFMGRLLERGFDVNPNAMLEAVHTTRIALPALMCPAFYDNYLSSFLSTHEKAMRHDQDSDRVKIERVLASRNELVGAFEAKGYRTSAVVDYHHWVPQLQPAAQRVYYCEDNLFRERGSLEASLAEAAHATQGNGRQMLEAIAFPFQTLINSTIDEDRRFTSAYLQEHASGFIDPEAVSRRELEAVLPGRDWIKEQGRSVNGFVYSLKKSQSPSLTIVYFMAAHEPYRLDAEGHRIAPANDRIEDPAYYPGQYAAAKELVLHMVDRILQQDPDAVIVLQGDHGLQGMSPPSFQQAMGRSISERALWNNVLCALRVPQRFRTGEEARATENPLNMTRYLVNSFVGRRYEYVKD